MPARIFIILLLVLTPFMSLFADIIITIDDMVLNGKILEENNKTVKFGNYHGIFIIDIDKIKEIYRTGSYEDDIKILNDKGKTVNADEVKTNYDSGLKKIEELEESREKTEVPASINLAVSPYIIFNLGELGTVLPYSYGISLTADLPVSDFSFAKKVFVSYITIDAGYFFSMKDERSATGYRASAGPQWRFPVLTGTFQMEYIIAPLFGAGWYNVQGLEEKMSALKWNACVNTGLVFQVSSITVSTLLKFDYIYDTAAPLYGIGAVLSIGYSF